MRFIALSPLVGLSLLVGVLVLIVVAYLLKPRRRQVTVGSLALWAKVLRKQGNLVHRSRWWISLLLSLLVGAAMALALTRPEVPALGAVSQRVVLVMDNSPSMAARTRAGGTRWTLAVTDARNVLAALGNASEVMLLDTMGRAPLTGFSTPALVLRQLDAIPLVTAGIPRFPDLPAEHVSVHAFSDGVAFPAMARGVRLHSVFEPAVNVGVTAFATRINPVNGSAVEGLVQVFNASAIPAVTQVTVSGPGLEWTGSFNIAAGESVDAIVDLSKGAAGVYSARAQAEGDALEVDDRAYAVVAPHGPRSVLLITPGDSLLEDSLRALPGIRVTVARPAQYRADAPFDSVLFDRFSAPAMPAGGALMLGSDRGRGRSDDAMAEVQPGRWDSTHPVTGGIAWHDLRVRHTSVGGQSDGRVLVQTAAGEGLISVGENGARWVRVNFDLDQSNFRMQPGFPVFLGQALRWLNEGGQVPVRALGDVSLPLPRAQIRDMEGRAVPSYATPAGTGFQALRPGVFTASAQGRDLQLIANVADPDYSRINASSAPVRASQRVAAAAVPRFARTELWTLLLAVAAALMLLEWFTLTRRMSV